MVLEYLWLDISKCCLFDVTVKSTVPILKKNKDLTVKELKGYSGGLGMRLLYVRKLYLYSLNNINHESTIQNVLKFLYLYTFLFSYYSVRNLNIYRENLKKKPSVRKSRSL